MISARATEPETLAANVPKPAILTGVTGSVTGGLVETNASLVSAALPEIVVASVPIVTNPVVRPTSAPPPLTPLISFKSAAATVVPVVVTVIFAARPVTTPFPPSALVKAVFISAVEPVMLVALTVIDPVLRAFRAINFAASRLESVTMRASAPCPVRRARFVS